MQIAIFIMVFFSSMSGAQLLGISLNKVALIPTFILLLVEFINSKNTKMYISSLGSKIIGLYFVSVFSCLYGMLSIYSKYDEYSERLIAYAVQSVFIYIPMLLLFYNSKKKYVYTVYFFDSLVKVCRIQGLWALVQFVLYYAVNLNLNELVFENILGGIIQFAGGYVRFSYETGSLAIRSAGLNSDPAYLCILMVLGFVFDSHKLINKMYIIVMALTLSRVGIVVCIILVLWRVFWKIKEKSIKLAINKIIAFAFGVAVVSIIFIVMYTKVSYVQTQIDYLFFRFINIFSEQNRNQSSVRHMLYLPYSIIAYFTELDLFQKIFGVGGRVTTVVFAENNNMADVLQFSGSLLKKAAATECDVAEILLGYGAIGFYLYYSFIYQTYKYGDKISKTCMLAVFVYGLMYDISTITIIQLVLWFECISIEKQKHQNETEWKGMKNDIYINS